jgi:hypothetical protein
VLTFPFPQVRVHRVSSEDTQSGAVHAVCETAVRGPGPAGVRTGGGLIRAVRIDDDSMMVEINGVILDRADRKGEWWRVGGWPRLLTRNQAITALAVAEWLLSGRDSDSPLLAAWRGELADD